MTVHSPRGKFRWPSLAHKEVLRGSFRRVVFLIWLLNFVGANIRFNFLITNLTFWFMALHALYFELDLAIPHHSHNHRPIYTTFLNPVLSFLTCILHPLSFCGSFIIGVLATLLVVVFNPGFLEQRAKQEGHPLFVAWIFTAWVHYLPAVLCVIDLLLHRNHLALHYQLSIWESIKALRQKPSDPAINNGSTLTQKRPHFYCSLGNTILHVLKLSWIIVSAPSVFFLWIALGFTPQQVYGTPNNNYAIAIPTMLAVHLLSVGLLLFCVDSRHHRFKRDVRASSSSNPDADAIIDEEPHSTQKPNLREDNALLNDIDTS